MKISAVCTQSNLLATILSQEPLVTECITLHAWTNKDSSLLAGSIQSELSSHQYVCSQTVYRSLLYSSPLGGGVLRRRRLCEWTDLNASVSWRIWSTSSVSASAGTVVACAGLGNADSALITLLRIVSRSGKGFTLEAGIHRTLIGRRSKSEGREEYDWKCE